MEYALETYEVSKRYRNTVALDRLTMHIPRGAIYGLVGKNGAGKTTLIRLLCGLQAETAGEFSIFGIKSKDPMIRKSRRRMGAVVETPSIYLNMTAKENLKQQYRVLGLPSYAGLEELLCMVGLEDTGKKKAKDFSLGMRQRLGIAVALVGEPDFLVLDEPVNGLDPQGIIEVRELILKLNREKALTVLISSHILEELSKLATWYGFIDQGRLVREMSAKELEAASRKSMRVTATDVVALSQALDELDMEYHILTDHTADIYGDLNVSELVHALDAYQCEISDVHDNGESLESFFMDLVGTSSENARKGGAASA